MLQHLICQYFRIQVGRLLLGIFFFCVPPSSAGWSEDVDEHCLGIWTRSGSCELRSRLTRRATQGTSKG